MRISDWSSDVCSSDLRDADLAEPAGLAIALDELHQYPRDLRQARQAELAELARGREPAFIVGRRTDRGGEAEDQSALDLLVRDRRVDEPPGVDDRDQLFDLKALVALPRGLHPRDVTAAHRMARPTLQIGRAHV